MIFLAHSPDQIGLIAKISQFFATEHVNIVNLEEHTERDRFFIRIEGHELNDSKQPLSVWRDKISSLMEKLDMEYEFYDVDSRLKVTLMCSGTLHCPLEIISRELNRDLNIKIEGIISNSLNIESIAEKIDIPFYHTPTIKGHHGHELVILARYMKVLSENFLNNCPCPVVNIHHSFLPSFIGNDPYEQAYERGVKLIGATSHFVSPELDAGPIISQNVTPVQHQYNLEEMKRMGADIEKQVLSDAIRKFAEHKVIKWEGRTVVFH